MCRLQSLVDITVWLYSPPSTCSCVYVVANHLDTTYSAGCSHKQLHLGGTFPFGTIQADLKAQRATVPGSKATRSTKSKKFDLPTV